MLSPLEDRYFEKIKDIHEIFGEINYYKLLHELEVLYLKFFISKKFNYDYQNESLNWDDSFFFSIKEIENVNKHDIFSVCENIKNIIKDDSFEHNFYQYKVKNFVHFGLTSSDIKGLADTIQIIRCNSILLDDLIKLNNLLINKGFSFKDFHTPTFTHGKLATPNNLSDYFFNASVSVDKFINSIEHNTKFLDVKFGGANGNFNSLMSFFSKKNLRKFKIEFIEKIQIFFQLPFDNILTIEHHTTQISNNIDISNYFSILRNLSYKMIDICQNFWLLNSKDIIVFQINTNEIGSSTMPHKNNPILLENAEGNFKFTVNLTNSMLEGLLISRLHRDLSGSTILRNIGLTFGHLILAIRNMFQAIMLIEPNKNYNLDIGNDECLMEYYQILFKFIGDDTAYEKCKKFSRTYNKPNISDFFLLFPDEILKLKNRGFKIISKPSEYSNYWGDK